MSESVPPFDEPNRPLRHLAFVRLASTLAEDSIKYRTALAGFLVLRLLDKWSTQVSDERTLPAREFVLIKRAVEELPDNPLRRTLSELVNAISAFAYHQPDTRASLLVDYARLLEETLDWELAADVYQTVIELGNPSLVDTDVLLHGYSRVAYCLRQTGAVDQAEESLRDGIEMARQLRSEYWGLRLRIAMAMILLHKGDLPAAEAQLDVVIVDAERVGEIDALARARHNRGLVAYERGQCEKAAAYFYSAANGYHDVELAQRALADVAMALSDLGQLDYARRTYTAIRNASSNPTEIRTLAGLNLMRIAVLSAEQKTFESLRQLLTTEEMSGRFRAHYHLISGQGFRRFGQTAFARASFESAILVAQEHKVNRLVIEAESMLAAEGDERPAPRKDVRASPDLAELLSDITEGRGKFAGTV